MYPQEIWVLIRDVAFLFSGHTSKLNSVSSAEHWDISFTPKNSAEEKVGFLVAGGRKERPTGCSRHAAVILHCGVTSRPEKRNIRQEPSVMRSRAAEGLLCTGPG